MGLVRVDFMPSLGIIRVAKLLDMAAKSGKVPHLQEIVLLLKKSLSNVFWMISIMVLSTVFIGMFLNNLTVE